MPYDGPEGAAVALPSADGPERSVLSSMMQEPEEMIPRAIEAGLVPHWFHSPSRRRLCEVFLELHGGEEPIELVSLTQLLRDRDLLGNMGGASELAAIYGHSPSHAHFEHHLAIVKDKWFRRSVLSHVRKVASACYDAPNSAEVVDLLVKPVEDLLEEQDGNKDITTGTHAVSEWLDNWKAQYHGEAELDIVSSGLPFLDDHRGGIDKPGLTYIGGFPSMGKTMMWLQAALHRLQQGDRVLLFSLEMTRRQLVTRLMIHLCQFDDPGIITSPGQSVIRPQMERIAWASRIMANESLIIDDRSGLSIEQIEARTKLEHRKGPLGFVGVDYVQLVGAGKVETVEQRMTQVSHGLQRIMKSTRASVVVLSQLTAKDGGSTEMKYARSLEEDADLALRIQGNVQEKLVNSARITKDRQRGRTGNYPEVRFDKMRQTFWSAAS